MNIANVLRSKLNRPIKFDLDRAVAEAQAAAHHELNRLEDPSVAHEVARWEGKFDPLTDAIECDQDGKGRRR